MSASLVGSEMCIRDSRPLPAPASGPSGPSCRLRASACGRLQSGPARPWCCLLYTSDAADDM
eukprot:2679291-Alexandrium_andersonii.AAC.1